MYARIENGSVRHVQARPRWSNDAGEPVSDEFLAQHGWLPVADGPPDYDPDTQRIERQPAQDWTVHNDHVTTEYSTIDLTPEEIQEREDRLAAEAEERDFQERYNPRRLVSLLQTMVDRLIPADDLSEEELSDLVDLYPAWQPGVVAKAGKLRRYDGGLYRCIQEHTTQADWTPPETPSLWEETVPSGVIQAWTPPTGAHDAPNLGDLRTHNDRVWESMRDGNTSEPGTDQWWTDVTDEHT